MKYDRPAARAPVLRVAEPSRRRAHVAVTPDSYDYHSLLIASGRTAFSKRGVEGHRPGCPPRPRGHCHPACALHGAEGPSRGESQPPLLCEGSASGAVRRPSRGAASGHLAAGGIENARAECGFHAEGGRAREPRYPVLRSRAKVAVRDRSALGVDARGGPSGRAKHSAGAPRTWFRTARLPVRLFRAVSAVSTALAEEAFAVAS